MEKANERNNPKCNDCNRPWFVFWHIPSHRTDMIPLDHLAILLFCMCTMCYVACLDWQAMAVAIVAPALLLGASDIDMRAAYRPPMRRPELYGSADTKRSFPR